MLGSTGKELKEDDPAAALVREVGAQLREARLQRGEELEDVAEYLRIRATYLFALEQGDLAVIPGRAYALGFLRSYARYLGFDGEDLIAQTRSSIANLTGVPHLHERTPLSESRLPKLPILVVSLAALAGAYAGWAYVDGRGHTEIDLVDEVPQELQEQARAVSPEPAAPQAGVRETMPPRATGADVEDAVEPETGGPAEVAAETPILEAQSSAVPPDVPSASAAVAQPRPAMAPADAVVGPPRIVPAQAMTTPADAEAEAEEAATPSRAGPSAPVAPDAVPVTVGNADRSQEVRPPARSAADILAALGPVEHAVATPTIYRADDAGGRIILRALSTSWVHVSSTSNDYLWVKIMQPGDAFVAPDRSDLVLWTGNAGGIEVIVDGTPLPPLGRDADVVRDLPLQPQALLSRLLPTPAAGAKSAQESGNP